MCAVHINRRKVFLHHFPENNKEYYLKKKGTIFYGTWFSNNLYVAAFAVNIFSVRKVQRDFTSLCPYFRTKN